MQNASLKIVLVSKQGAVTYLQDQDFVAKLVL